MHAYIPTREDLKEIIRETVQETVEKSLPGAIRKATRKRWLTTDEAMKMLQCSRRHLQYLRDEEKIPFSKNGRVIRYDIEDIEAFLNDNKI